MKPLAMLFILLLCVTACDKSFTKIIVFMYSDEMETSAAITPQDIKNMAEDSFCTIDDTLFIKAKEIDNIVQIIKEAKKGQKAIIDARVYFNIDTCEFIMDDKSRITDIKKNRIILPRNIRQGITRLWKCYVRNYEKENQNNNKIPRINPKKEYWKVILYIEP